MTQAQSQLPVNTASVPVAKPPRTASVQLSRKQKAAIIVRFLLAEGTEFSLAELPEPIIAELGRQMTTLRRLDHVVVDAVIQEFLEELDGNGLSFPKGLDGALAILDKAIGSETASRIRREAGLTIQGDPWQRIGSMDSELLLPILQEESVEVAAVMLSKIRVSLAAELLGKLPGERARRITYAVSLTGNIAPQVVQRIGLSLALQLDAQPVRAFVAGPVERVGAILNFSPSNTRDDVLEGLEQADSGFATEVRKAIFTFANIPARIDPRDIPKITRDIDQGQLVTAMAAASGDATEATEFILSNMSQRMSSQMREDMEAMGKIKERDGEDAMNAVVAVIRELEAAGDIFLVAEDD